LTIFCRNYNRATHTSPHCKPLIIYLFIIFLLLLSIYVFILQCLLLFIIYPLHLQLTHSSHNFFYQCLLLFASFTTSVCYMVIFLTLQHTFLFNNTHSYISWAVYSWLCLASIVKWKHSPSHNLHTLICHLLPDHELSIIILPLFLFHDPFYISLCLTLMQYIQLIYATLGCRQFTFSDFLAIAIRWYSTI